MGVHGDRSYKKMFKIMGIKVSRQYSLLVWGERVEAKGIIKSRRGGKDSKECQSRLVTDDGPSEKRK